MKLAGVVRRIDELGRIVVPKEIRKTLRIKSGENLEIFVSDNNIILRKYSQIDKLNDIAQAISQTLNLSLKANILIANNDKYIIASGSQKRDYIDKEISSEILKIIENRKSIILKDQTLKLIEDKEENANYIISPIIVQGDIIGTIIVFSQDNLTEETLNTIKIISNILAKYIEQ